MALIVPRGADCDPTLHGDVVALVVALAEGVLDTVGERVGVAEGFEGPDEHAAKTSDRKTLRRRIVRRCTPPL